MPINESGICEGLDENTTSGHYYDNALINQIIVFLKDEKVKKIVDLGCGDGKYVKTLKETGILADGFDGNPSTPEYTNNLCGVLDLSIPYQFAEKYDWVISLEVGEHLPKHFEDIFIGNLHNNNKYGIILSWAVKGQGGYGHFNEQDNDYVKSKICNLGYTNDIESELKMREAATIPWFKNTIMVFRKIIN